MLKQLGMTADEIVERQPPLGGCVLKHQYIDGEQRDTDQPPLGGCVLKHTVEVVLIHCQYQPPLGGCVLKQYRFPLQTAMECPAAFRRLCVET